MKWIELIMVRASDTRHKPTIRRLMDQLGSNRRPEGLAAVFLYHNAFVETDFCLSLQWDRDVTEPPRSDLGKTLASTLCDFGRVHHTIWIDEGSFPEIGE